MVAIGQRTQSTETQNGPAKIKRQQNHFKEHPKEFSCIDITISFRGGNHQNVILNSN